MTRVTNGVLCFLTTARQSYSTENLILMCISFYSHERILDAKKVLFSLTGGESAITRRGEGKFRSDVSDILIQIKKTEENGTELPDFVADSYKSMPPSSGFEVLAEHVVCLIDEMNSLRKEVKSLKDLNSVTSGVVDMKEEIRDIKCMLMQDMSRGLVTGGDKADRNKNVKLEIAADKRENSIRNGSSSENVPKARPSSENVPKARPSSENVPKARTTEPVESSDNTSYSDAVKKKKNENEDNEIEERWTKIEPRPKTRITIRGNKKMESTLKAADNTMDA